MTEPDSPTRLAIELSLIANNIPLSDPPVQHVVRTHMGVPAEYPLTAESIEKIREKIQAEMENLDPSTLDNFLALNAVPQPIEPPYNLCGGVLPLEDSAIADIFRDNDGWSRFARAHPGSDGFSEFSRVGFNAAGTQALLYCATQRAPGRGEGWYLLFVQNGETWEGTDQVMAWW